MQGRGSREQGIAEGACLFLNSTNVGEKYFQSKSRARPINAASSLSYVYKNISRAEGRWEEIGLAFAGTNW